MTLTYEMMMPEGKALQSCTSHDLGQNFSTSFGIEFQAKDGTRQHPWQTSWGLSTRSIGGLILVHGDDKGLRLPPKLAPVQIVILPVRVEDAIVGACQELAQSLEQAGYRVKLDLEDGQTIGWKINKWEIRGVPVRIEIGQRELDAGMLKIVRRDTDEKIQIPLADVVEEMGELLENVHSTLFAQAEQLLKEKTREINSWDEFVKTMEAEKGFLKSFWCGQAECEAKIKEETKATTRCLAEEHVSGSCIRCGEPAAQKWYFAQSY
jgi:prolyl-tRNA synthetase